MKKAVYGIGIGILCLIVIAVNITIAWFVYTTFFAPKEEPAQKQEVSQSAIVVDVLSEIQKNAEESQAWGNYLVVRQDETAQSSNTFVYTKTDLSGGPLGVEPSTSLRITQNTGMPFDAAAFTEVEKMLTKVLTENDVREVTLTTPSEILSSYSGKDISCSLTGTPASTFVTLACASNQYIQEASATVKEIAQLQANNVSSAAYLQYRGAYNGSKANAVATLDVFKSENMKAHSLVYTYGSEGWTYVDDALSAVPGESNGGKAASTQKLQTLTKDPVYGPLYLDLLGAKK